MERELQILRFIESNLGRNSGVVLLVVIESSGSSPGRAGFKMAVSADGSLFGSIGGGVMEVNLVEQAREFLTLEDPSAAEKFGHSRVFGQEQVHQKGKQNSSGMICSGKQQVVFVKILPSEIKSIRRFVNSLTKSKKGIFEITDRGLRIVTPTDNEFEKYWSAIRGKTTTAYTFSDWGYAEKLGSDNKLYIVGGGHCSLALSELMSKLDFHITVFDDRPTLNTLQKNEFADSIKRVESYETLADFIESGSDVYVAVMTLGYKFDEIVIRRLIDKKFKYFGVLGSKAKMKTLLKSLENEGFDKKKLAKIRTPIGLSIKSQTPFEIAVSIAAEIISVKNSAK